nr:hypothetical protein CFP56_68854 [Quercus suber]
MAEIHTSDEAVSPGEDWEIAVTTEMKHKMVGPCKLGSSSNSQVDSLGIELFKPGHREVNCLEQHIVITHTNLTGLEPHAEPRVPVLEKNHSPWKTVQMRRSSMHGKITENPTRGKFTHRNAYTLSKPCEVAPSTDPLVMRSPHAISVTS